MADHLSIALTVSVIGMSAVVGLILLLWVVMALLMRLPAERAAPDGGANDRALKQRAAAAAVAAALAREAGVAAPAFAVPSTALVSPWQAVMRANQLKQRGPVR
jgi:hypothetical protein